MKSTLIALALVAGAGAAMPALAQTTPDDDNLIRTRDITGGSVYSMAATYDVTAWGADTYYVEIDTDWVDIGEIEDVILNRDGQMIGIVAEVGGFLDIGDKHVMLPVEDVRLVAIDDGEYAYVTRYSEEQLEALENVDEGWWD